MVFFKCRPIHYIYIYISFYVCVCACVFACVRACMPGEITVDLLTAEMGFLESVFASDRPVVNLLPFCPQLHWGHLFTNKWVSPSTL